MKGLLVAAFCVLSLSALAADKTPYAMARVPDEFKENEETFIYFQTKVTDQLVQAAMCKGENCQIEAGSVGYNQDAGPEFKSAPSNKKYSLKEGDIVGLLYNVQSDNMSRAHKRYFRLDKNADAKSGFSFVLISEPEVAVEPVKEQPAEAAKPAETIEATPANESPIQSYEHLMSSLMASGPDQNLNGIADRLDVCYYGVYGYGTCGDFAKRAVDSCRGWGLPARVLLGNVWVTQRVLTTLGWQYQQVTVLHAKVRVWIKGVAYDFEPQLGGGPLTPSDTGLSYDSY